MRVLAGQDRGPAGAADRVGHDAAVEPHPLPGQAVDVRRLDQPARIVVGADGLVGMVVAEDEDDIGGGSGGAGFDCRAAVVVGSRVIAPMMTSAS